MRPELVSGDGCLVAGWWVLAGWEGGGPLGPPALCKEARSGAKTPPQPTSKEEEEVCTRGGSAIEYNPWLLLLYNI